MLVLSRKENETIVIGDVEISIKKIRGKQVRIGITAPPSVQILRGELVGVVSIAESNIPSIASEIATT